MRTESHIWLRGLGALLLAVVPAGGCGEAPGTDGEGARNGGEAPPLETKTSAVSTTCTIPILHGGSLLPETFKKTVSCPLNPGFHRTSASPVNIGAGSCAVIGWTTSDIHDGTVDVAITNAGGLAQGNCGVTIFQDSDPPSHSLCDPGAPLFAVASPCATSVCATDPFCCGTRWDGICVGEVRSVCHSLICPAPPCTHAECRTGDPLVNGCNPPVTAICARDSFCCSVHWDTICVGEVSSFAGQTCGL